MRIAAYQAYRARGGAIDQRMTGPGAFDQLSVSLPAPCAPRPQVEIYWVVACFESSRPGRHWLIGCCCQLSGRSDHSVEDDVEVDVEGDGAGEGVQAEGADPFGKSLCDVVQQNPRGRRVPPGSQ